MLNRYNVSNYSTSNVNINAVTGAILKNHPKSWFERFHLTSPRANTLLTEGGHKATQQKWHEGYNSYDRGYYSTEKNPDKDIIVLQMVICGDMEVLAELVYAKDYNTVVTPMEE